MITIQIKSGEAQVMLQKAAERCQNLAPAMTVVATRLKTDIHRNFAEGGWYPEKWRISRRAQTESGQTLVDHGLLRRSIQAASGRDWAQAGSDVAYAAAHQFGHTFPPRTVRARNAKALRIPLPGGDFIYRKSAKLPGFTLPARPFLPVNGDGQLAPETDAFVGRVFARYVSKGIS